MPRDWARDEVEATVAAYFEMLRAELSSAAYNKADYRRRLLPQLQGRSEQSVEFKHANISAILIELGFPFIAGYKPRSNYQGLLRDVVSARLAADPQLRSLAAADATQLANVPSVDDILASLTDPPTAVPLRNRVSEPPARYSTLPVNYLEREALNRSLGLAGEEFVVNFECARLIHAGRESLASRIEHVAKSRGDNEGFDVLSFEATGADRLIEVKTTKYGAHTPFYVSRNELDVSIARASHYHLYRVFEFRSRPLLFTLHGAFSSTCRLDPSSYIATVS